jgi:hypothetical protein
MEEIGIAVEKKVCRTSESLGLRQLIGIKWLQWLASWLRLYNRTFPLQQSVPEAVPKQLSPDELYTKYKKLQMEFDFLDIQV